MDELQAGVEFTLAVLAQPPVLFQPGKAALDDPALWDDGKLVQLAALGDLHCGGLTQYLPHTQRKRLAHIACVSEYSLHLAQARLAAAHRLQRAFAICHVRRRHRDGVRQTLGIDRNMAFDARDLFSCVIPSVARCVSVLDALCIHDQQPGLCAAP